MGSFAIHSNSGAWLLHAKNIDYTPDITSDAYWDGHYISRVRITRTGKDDSGFWVTYTVTDVFSNGRAHAGRTVHVSEFWFGNDVVEPPGLTENQRIILYEDKSGGPIVVSVAGDNDQELAALSQIARLRKESGATPAVLESTFDPNPLVSLYCLRRMQDATSLRAPDGYSVRLVAFRNEPSRPARPRILAARLDDRLEGRRDGSDVEYEWLKQAIPHSPATDWTELKPFIDRILEFESKRAETISLLTGVVRQADAPQPLRIAAYSSLDDARLFHYESPDAPSELIFATCVQMLSDRDGAIRAAGAAQLHNIVVRVAPKYAGKYVQEAKRALQTARDRETDSTVQFQLGHFLTLLERRTTP